MRNEEWAPPGVDYTRPSIARVYDFMLGGKDNFAIDRRAAEKALKITPDGFAAARWNRVFLRRVVRYLASEAGIDQFLDIGSGLPTQGNVHEVAAEVNPASRVVYVDSDPMVLAHARALLANARTTMVKQADARFVDQIIGCPEVRRYIDISRPVGLLMFGILHHFNDDEQPEQIAASYRDAIAPGSYLAISHFHNPEEAHPEASVKALMVEKVFLDALGSGRFRTRDEILAYFGDFELIEPGLVPFPQWRPGSGDEAYDPIDIYHTLVGGVARKL
ncbi:MAG: SAM-dependent methyltransferase [Micromonosporaceae bacterium]|nr:SAM-dependent methyltransferase [Micromonosporaceae bacterium]